jgi:molecular chaperone DnaK (HSP70)
MAKLLTGIDLGTTTTLVAYLRENNVVVVPDPETAQNHTESAVLLGADGLAQAVGEIARNQLSTPDGEWVVIEPKRAIGTEQRFPAAHPRLLAHQVMSEILYYRLIDLARYAATFAAQTLAVLIAVPAYYGDLERKRTVEAFDLARHRLRCAVGSAKLECELAGLVDEPLAAAICHSAESQGLFEGSPFIVLDLGGGTFDVTAYQTALNNHVLSVNVLAKDGEQRLGGADWDEVLVEIWLDHVARQTGTRPSLPPERYYELKLECESKRRALGRLPKTTIRGSVGQQNSQVLVTRDDFEARSADLLRRLRECIERVMGSVRATRGLDSSAFNVLLVGGATHMPMVQAEIRRLFNASQVMQTPDPQQVVARGAGYYCAIRNGFRFPVPALRQIHDIAVRDILTRSYGILGRHPDGRYGLSVVLSRNTVCDGTEYMFDQVALSKDLDHVVPLAFGAVPEWHAAHQFVPLPENDPKRVVQRVELQIPAGVRAMAQQRLRVFLRPGENGVISGRAELMDQKDGSKRVSDVTFTWTTGG